MGSVAFSQGLENSSWNCRWFSQVGSQDEGRHHASVGRSAETRCPGGSSRSESAEGYRNPIRVFEEAGDQDRQRRLADLWRNYHRRDRTTKQTGSRIIPAHFSPSTKRESCNYKSHSRT